MRIALGSTRIVILTKKFAYKFPIFFRGIRANRLEYKNFKKRRGFVAETEKHWWGLKQERLFNCLVYPLETALQSFGQEHKHLYKLKLHSKSKVGQDTYGCWKFYGYEDIKYLEKIAKEKHIKIK